MPSCSRNSPVVGDHSLPDSNRRSPYSSLSVPYTSSRTPSPWQPGIKHSDGYVMTDSTISSVKCNSNSVQRSYAENVNIGHAASFSELPLTNSVTKNSLSNGPVSHSALSSQYTCTSTLTNSVPSASTVMSGQVNMASGDAHQNYKHFLAQTMSKEQNARPSTNGPLSISDTELAIKSVAQSGHEFSMVNKSTKLPSGSMSKSLSSASLSSVNVDRKGKPPVIYGPGGESVSLENSVCFSSGTESTENVLHTQVNCDFDGSGLDQKGAEHLLKSQLHNNLEQQKGSNITSKYTRKSPASSMLNSLSQQYFNPALPLAKRLTESVQKLVKPLPFSDSSTLPQSQKKLSVSTAGNKANANPPTSNSTRINRTQHEFGSAKHISGVTESFTMHDLTSSHPDNSVSKTLSDITASESLSMEDNQAKSVENRLKDNTDYFHKELISNSVTSTVSAMTDVDSVKQSSVTSASLQDKCYTLTVSSSCSVGNGLDSVKSVHTTTHSERNIVKNSNSASEISVPVTGTMSSCSSSNRPILSSSNSAGENLESKSDTQLGNSQESNSHKSMPYCESFSSANSLPGHNSQTSNCDDRLLNKTVDSVIDSVQSNTNTVNQSHSAECNKSSVRNTQKTAVSTTTPVTQHCKVSESNVISLSSQNLQQDTSTSSEKLLKELSTHTPGSIMASSNSGQTSTESTLPKYTIVKTQKSENSSEDNTKTHMQTSKEAVNPSAGSEAVASSGDTKHSSDDRSEIQAQSSGIRQSKQETSECGDESQPPLTMTLRKRNVSESSDTSPTLQHNLRPKRTNTGEAVDGVKQTPSDNETTTMSLRTSRRRKNAQNDLDVIEPSKKANFEEGEGTRHATRSTEVKENITVTTNKNEAERKVEPLGINCSDESNDSVSSVDTIKTGLRARSQPKGGQVEIKSGVKEQPSTRRNSQSRRGRQSPVTIQDKSVTVCKYFINMYVISSFQFKDTIFKQTPCCLSLLIFYPLLLHVMVDVACQRTHVAKKSHVCCEIGVCKNSKIADFRI